jgi:hypothetical protein
MANTVKITTSFSASFLHTRYFLWFNNNCIEAFDTLAEAEAKYDEIVEALKNAKEPSTIKEITI